MNLTEVFKKIEMALTPQDEAPQVQEEVKVEMATMKLANGVVLEAESFEAGENVFLLGEDDEKVAAPVGEHELEDGRMLIVEEEGVIIPPTNGNGAHQELRQQAYALTRKVFKSLSRRKKWNRRLKHLNGRLAN